MCEDDLDLATQLQAWEDLDNVNKANLRTLRFAADEVITTIDEQRAEFIRHERRCRRLRALADGYRERSRYSAADAQIAYEEGLVVGNESERKQERARIVAALRTESRTGKQYYYPAVVLSIADKLEAGEL